MGASASEDTCDSSVIDLETGAVDEDFGRNGGCSELNDVMTDAITWPGGRFDGESNSA